MPPRLLALLALTALLCAACRENAPPPPATALGLDGAPVDPLGQDAAVVVLLFARTDCPISNRYAPEINRIVAAYAPRGVETWLVYPNPATSPEQIRGHVTEYGYTCSAARDPRHALVDLARATITPEAAVFDAERNLVYRGRIDDWYVELGQARHEPTTHDLRDAIDAALSGGTVAEPRTKAIGCFIADLSKVR